ncbi:MAG: putative membrane protein YvlC [Promethearchaeota archaeon]|nr:MAG: putative membrane protein YvlC [Candidatus Lokiarchaeota archaeon]
MPKKLLYRSKKNVKIAGVCGGIGEYMDIDPTVVRIIWIIATVATGIMPGIIAYILAWIVMPEK